MSPDWERRFRAPTRTLPSWSRHAPERMVFRSDEEGSYQAYAWDRASGGMRRATDEPVGVAMATVSADGSEVVWFSDATGDESGSWLAVSFEGGEPRALLPGAPIGWPSGLAVGLERVVGVIADRDGFGVYVSERGGPARAIHRDVESVSFSDLDYHLEGFDLVGLSADETLVGLEVSQDDDGIHRALLTLDAQSGEVVGTLADGPGLALDAYAWSPAAGDPRLLVGHERDDMVRPAVWNPVTGERQDLEPGLPGDVVPVDWWPDARSILVVHLFRGRHQLFRLDLEGGSLTEVRHPPGEVHGARVRPDGRVWLRVSSGDRAPAVLDDTGREVLPAAPGGDREGRPYLEWRFRNVEGEWVHGWLVVPEGDGPHPVYLKVHGGPNWLYLDTWWPDVQSLADAGFVVAMVNYRGSIGFGRRWRDHIIRDIGFPEVQDVVAGLDDLLARGIADPERVTIGGWSWGGYITLLALGLHPDRFVAGVGAVPVGDYMASYEDSAPSLQAFDRALVGGVVHDLPEFVRERSPVTYVDRVRAKVLVLVGEHDTRCPPRQVHAYVEALERAGGDVELYSYEEGHSSYVVEEEIREWGTVLEFLTRAVGSGSRSSLADGGEAPPQPRLVDR
ncbi:MAG TPA: alpha/beta fold hydrolase [Actinomycetota bacterium]